MIRDIVTSSREPVVHLRVRGPTAAVTGVDLVVDTGFTGALVLPAAVVATLGLPWRSSGTAVLADGSTHQTDYHEAELEWGPGWVAVLAMSVGLRIDRPLGRRSDAEPLSWPSHLSKSENSSSG